MLYLLQLNTNDFITSRTILYLIFSDEFQFWSISKKKSYFFKTQLKLLRLLVIRSSWDHQSFYLKYTNPQSPKFLDFLRKEYNFKNHFTPLCHITLMFLPLQIIVWEFDKSFFNRTLLQKTCGLSKKKNHNNWEWFDPFSCIIICSQH